MQTGQMSAEETRSIVAPGSSTVDLTEREEQIAYLVSLGYPHKQIANRLSISTNNVSVHIGRIAAKIGGDGSPTMRVAVWFLQHRSSEI